MIFIAAMAAIALPTVNARIYDAVYVDPPSQTVEVCTHFIVKVNWNATDPSSAIAFNLSFDPNLMECIEVRPTSFPPGWQEFEYSTEAGLVGVSIVIESGFTGFGTIAEIEFHCLDEGARFDETPLPSGNLYNGTVNQVIPPVGGEVLTIDSLALLTPWIAAAAAVAATTVLVLASRRTFYH